MAEKRAPSLKRGYWIAAGVLIGLAAGTLFRSNPESSHETGNSVEPAAVEQEAVDHEAVDQEQQYSVSAPEFSLPDDSGEIVDLASFHGQPVLLNFWASWCPPCKQEMVTFEDRYQQHRDEGFVVLAVNSDDSGEVMQEFREQNDISFHLLQDHEKKVIQQYAVSALPTTFFIDVEGNVVNRHIGLLTGEMLDQYLVQLGIEN